PHKKRYRARSLHCQTHHRAARRTHVGRVERGEGLDILVRPADPRRAAHGGLMGRRILVIEDHEENRRILRDLLTSGGYEIIEATTGLEGVDMAEQEHPDLILMDIQLPGIDGYEATRRIKANPTLHRIPIIAVTSYALS